MLAQIFSPQQLRYYVVRLGNDAVRVGKSGRAVAMQNAWSNMAGRTH